MLLKILSSPSFWLAAALACSGGILVFRGLLLEKSSVKATEDQGFRLLLTGIALEVIAAFVATMISSVDAARSKERSLILESNNLILRSNVAALEIKLQDRTLSPQQHTNLVKCLASLSGPKGPLMIGSQRLTGAAEAEAYASQIIAAFNQAGGFFSSKEKLSLAVHPKPGLILMVKQPENPPPLAIEIRKCFIDNQIPVSEIELGSKFLSSNTESNIVVIWVSGKF